MVSRSLKGKKGSGDHLTKGTVGQTSPEATVQRGDDTEVKNSHTVGRTEAAPNRHHRNWAVVWDWGSRLASLRDEVCADHVQLCRPGALSLSLLEDHGEHLQGPVGKVGEDGRGANYLAQRRRQTLGGISMAARWTHKSVLPVQRIQMGQWPDYQGPD